MTTFSRRAANRRADVTQKLIAFRVYQEWFALPIQAACKVIPLGQLYGAPQAGGLSLTRYQDRDILVIDLKQRLFRNPPPECLLPGSVVNSAVANNAAVNNVAENNAVENNAAVNSAAENSAAVNVVPAFRRSPLPHLLIVQNQQGEFIGLPLDEPPLLRRVPKSAFTPLSPTYLTEGNVRCVCALVAPSNEETPLFLLNLDQLLQPQSFLLPGTSPNPVALPSAEPLSSQPHERTDTHSHPGGHPSHLPAGPPLRYSLFPGSPE